MALSIRITVYGLFVSGFTHLSATIVLMSVNICSNCMCHSLSDTWTSPLVKICLQISIWSSVPNALIRHSFLATWPLETFTLSRSVELRQDLLPRRSAGQRPYFRSRWFQSASRRASSEPPPHWLGGSDWWKWRPAWCLLTHAAGLRSAQHLAGTTGSWDARREHREATNSAEQ